MGLGLIVSRAVREILEPSVSPKDSLEQPSIRSLL